MLILTVQHPALCLEAKSSRTCFSYLLRVLWSDPSSTYSLPSHCQKSHLLCSLSSLTSFLHTIYPRGTSGSFVERNQDQGDLVTVFFTLSKQFKHRLICSQLYSTFSVERINGMKSLNVATKYSTYCIKLKIFSRSIDDCR